MFSFWDIRGSSSSSMDWSCKLEFETSGFAPLGGDITQDYKDLYLLVSILVYLFAFYVYVLALTKIPFGRVFFPFFLSIVVRFELSCGYYSTSIFEASEQNILRGYIQLRF